MNVVRGGIKYLWLTPVEALLFALAPQVAMKAYCDLVPLAAHWLGFTLSDSGIVALSTVTNLVWWITFPIILWIAIKVWRSTGASEETQPIPTYGIYFLPILIALIVPLLLVGLMIMAWGSGTSWFGFELQHTSNHNDFLDGNSLLNCMLWIVVTIAVLELIACWHLGRTRGFKPVHLE